MYDKIGRLYWYTGGLPIFVLYELFVSVCMCNVVQQTELRDAGAGSQDSERPARLSPLPNPLQMAWPLGGPESFM